MAATIEENIEHANVELIASGGGVFEIEVDGDLIYSKKQTGEFPAEDDIVAALGER
ncbi:MAG: Rdx family protein [Gemmatimonadetes bacterium]|nr:Rdx family protein [Gemmatimonadota bacterium]